MYTDVKRCTTLRLLHLGQVILLESRSENVMVTVNFFLQALQVYSYRGIFRSLLP